MERAGRTALRFKLSDMAITVDSTLITADSSMRVNAPGASFPSVEYFCADSTIDQQFTGTSTITQQVSLTSNID